MPVETALADAAAVRGALLATRAGPSSSATGSTIARGAANWAQVMADHGNSGSPAWAIFAAPIARLFGIGPVGQRVMGLIDPLLMIVLFTLFFRTFGTRPTCVALVIFSMMPFCFDYLAGSLLRWDWLFALGLAMVLWARDRPSGAGAAVGYAIASKLFPLFFAVGFGFWAGWEYLRTRKFDMRLLRFGAGAVAGMRAVGGDLVGDVRAARVARLRAAHRGGAARALLQQPIFVPHRVPAGGVVDAARVRRGTGCCRRRSRRRGPRSTTKPWRIRFFLLQLALTALVALGLRHADPIEAIAIGPLLVYVWLVVNAYYWNMLALTALAWGLRAERDRLLPLLGLHAMLMLVLRLSAPVARLRRGLLRGRHDAGAPRRLGRDRDAGGARRMMRALVVVAAHRWLRHDASAATTPRAPDAGARRRAARRSSRTSTA